ncbi:MAG: MaoC family dehydratase [Ardenticatenaceae bacterium]|nr:MaoC family dehydratase [Ardenticatenaceae bacterium]
MDEDLFDKIEVGDELEPVVREIDQDRINRYSEASGDYNPIHVDPEFAQKTRFGGTIAHGMLGLAFISQMMTNQFEYAWIDGGEMEVEFLAPVRPGDSITTRGKVIEKSEADRSITCEVYCENQAAKKVIAGQARISFLPGVAGSCAEHLGA